MPSQIRGTPPRTPIPPGPGRIVGRVLDRELHTPVANASVSVEYLGPGSGSGGLRPAVASRALTTDDAGGFVAADLAVGDYTVVASADGYTPARRMGTTIDPGEPVTISVNRLDASVTVRHSRVGVISGAVSDSTGSAVAGATVRILHSVFSSPVMPLLWQPMPVVTATDGNGRYAFTNVPPGDYIIGVIYKSVSIPVAVFDGFWKPSSPAEGDRLRARLADSQSVTPPAPAPAVAGPASTVDRHRWFVNNAIDLPLRTTDFLVEGGRRMTTFSGGADSVATAEVIAVEPGATRSDVNIRLRSGRGVKVSGVLVGKADLIAHVGLRLLPPAEHDVLQTFGGELASTITDAEGGFTFLDVPPGAAVLESVITSAAYGAPGLPPGIPRRTPELFVRARLDVPGIGLSDIKVPVRPLMNIRGRFEFEGESPAPRPAPTIVSLSAAGVRNPNVRARATSATEFAFEGLLPGRALFYVPGFRDWRVKSIAAGGRNLLGQAVHLEDTDLNDVVITFAIGHNRVTGIVRTPAGAIVNGAQVVVFPADFREWAGNGRSTMTSRTMRTAAAGTYNVATIADGEYYFAAFELDMARDWERLSSLEAISKVATKLRVSGGQTLTMDLITMTGPAK